MTHIPVLLSEVTATFEYLKNRKGYFLDATLGAGGHSLALLENIKNDQLIIIGVDRDENALKIAQAKIREAGLLQQFIFFHTDFKDVAKLLKQEKILTLEGALFDLGVSSMQLDQKERGFSFTDENQKLDMRMDKSQTMTAADILNHYPESRLVDILFKFGEEKLAKKIARNIIERRKEKPFDLIGDLLSVINHTFPKSAFFKKIHPATKTFQALRIAVNNELEGLSDIFTEVASMLSVDSKLAVISFHSLEDRLVKDSFRDLANPCKCPSNLPCICNKKPSAEILTKKPLIANEMEISQNRRSRSAKLRIIKKI